MNEGGGKTKESARRRRARAGMGRGAREWNRVVGSDELRTAYLAGQIFWLFGISWVEMSTVSVPV